MPERLAKFLACETSDYNDFLERESRSFREQVQRIKAERSPSVVEDGRINARIADATEAFVQKLLNCRLDVRRTYARDAPELLTDMMLRQLEMDLTNIATSTGGGYIDANASLRLTAFVQRAVRKLTLERELGLIDDGRRQTVNINIHNSTIAALNLGTVIGDVNATVTMLRDQGQQKVAEAIRALTEAVANADSLGADRRDLIESLSTIGEQATLPEEKRKPGLVRALVASLASALRTSADVAKIWDVFGPAVTAHFKLVFPG